MPQAEQEEKLDFIPSDAPAPEGEPKRVSIDLQEADDEAEEQAPKDQELRPIRHKSQWRQMREKHDGELTELRQQIARLEGRVSAPAPVHREAPAAKDPTADPVEKEIGQVWRMQQRTLAAIRSGQYPDNEVREMENDWREMDRRRRALESKADSPRQRSEEPPDRYAYGREILNAEFPEIFSEPYLQKMAEAEFEYLKNKRGKPDNIVTAREAAERVAVRQGVGRKSPPPSDAEKVRHSGVPGRAGATAASNGGQYTPTKYILELARAYTSHLPDLSDEDRYKHWRRYVGKKEGLVP